MDGFIDRPMEGQCDVLIEFTTEPVARNMHAQTVEYFLHRNFSSDLIEVVDKKPEQIR